MLLVGKVLLGRTGGRLVGSLAGPDLQIVAGGGTQFGQFLRVQRPQCLHGATQTLYLGHFLFGKRCAERLAPALEGFHGLRFHLLDDLVGHHAHAFGGQQEVIDVRFAPQAVAHVGLFSQGFGNIGRSQ